MRYVVLICCVILESAAPPTRVGANTIAAHKPHYALGEAAKRRSVAQRVTLIAMKHDPNPSARRDASNQRAAHRGEYQLIMTGLAHPASPRSGRHSLAQRETLGNGFIEFPSPGRGDSPEHSDVRTVTAFCARVGY